MITSWGVNNFKSIQNKVNLKLKPLTIFAGSNSSGKSTLLQSILLVSQTLSHKVDSHPVVLNGSLTNLGQFNDLKSFNGSNDHISITFTCRPRTSESGGKVKKLALTPRGPLYYGPHNTDFSEVMCEFGFDSRPDASDDEKILKNLQPRLLFTKLACKLRKEFAAQSASGITIRCREKISDAIKKAIKENKDSQLSGGLHYEVQLDEHSSVEIKADYMSAYPRGCVMRHFLPRRIIYEINAKLEMANAIANALQYGYPRVIDVQIDGEKEPALTKEILEELHKMLVNVVDLMDLLKSSRKPDESSDEIHPITIRDWYEKLLLCPPEQRIKIQQALREKDDLFQRIYDTMKESSTDGGQPTFVQDRPPEQITVASWYLSDFFSTSLHYLAPLREAPKPLYPLSYSVNNPLSVGTLGENTALVLEMCQNRTIEYLPSSAFNAPQINRTTAKATLLEAVEDWMRYLGVAQKIESSNLGKIGHAIRIALNADDQPHDLTHVGVGVSQVMPILVLSLLSDSDATLVLEQPELHLHPKTQTLLADFLLSLSLVGKQCIVETHSEYIVDRMRYRIAASDPDHHLSDLSMIYFVEKPNGSSTFREVEINDYGAIVNWPEGFFDQSYRQAADILRVAGEKRRKINGTNAEGLAGGNGHWSSDNTVSTDDLSDDLKMNRDEKLATNPAELES